MEISLGFVLVVLFIVLPGLVYRRFYFYGHFSKEFSSGFSLITLLAYAVIPGLILFVLSLWIYTGLIEPINFDLIADRFKDFFSYDFRSDKEKFQPFRFIKDEASKFTLFLYFLSWLGGILGGRLVRIFRLDTSFKLLRFKNYWFYFFLGQHTRLKNFRHLREENKKFLFTKADVLVDTNSGSVLYSGILIDYFLHESDCTTLSKVVLQNAERYSNISNGSRVPKSIPGAFLVVDCKNLININVTYVYENMGDEVQQVRRSKIELALSLFILLLSTTFLFKIDLINVGMYKDYFELNLFQKILIYLTIIQCINIFYPFQRRDGKLVHISGKMLVVKVLWLVLLLFLSYKFVMS